MSKCRYQIRLEKPRSEKVSPAVKEGRTSLVLFPAEGGGSYAANPLWGYNQPLEPEGCLEHDEKVQLSREQKGVCEERKSCLLRSLSPGLVTRDHGS